MSIHACVLLVSSEVLVDVNQELSAKSRIVNLGPKGNLTPHPLESASCMNCFAGSSSSRLKGLEIGVTLNQISAPLYPVTMSVLVKPINAVRETHLAQKS